MSRYFVKHVAPQFLMSFAIYFHCIPNFGISKYRWSYQSPDSCYFDFFKIFEFSINNGLYFLLISKIFLGLVRHLAIFKKLGKIIMVVSVADRYLWLSCRICEDYCLCCCTVQACALQRCILYWLVYGWQYAAGFSLPVTGRPLTLNTCKWQHQSEHDGSICWPFSQKNIFVWFSRFYNQN